MANEPIAPAMEAEPIIAPVGGEPISPVEPPAAPTVEEYTEARGVFLNDPRYLALSREQKIEKLNTFFDQISTPFLMGLSEGQATPEELSQFRQQFLSQYGPRENLAAETFRRFGLNEAAEGAALAFDAQTPAQIQSFQQQEAQRRQQEVARMNRAAEYNPVEAALARLGNFTGITDFDPDVYEDPAERAAAIQEYIIDRPETDALPRSFRAVVQSLDPATPEGQAQIEQYLETTRTADNVRREQSALAASQTPQRPETEQQRITRSLTQPVALGNVVVPGLDMVAYLNRVAPEGRMVMVSPSGLTPMQARQQGRTIDRGDFYSQMITEYAQQNPDGLQALIRAGYPVGTRSLGPQPANEYQLGLIDPMQLRENEPELWAAIGGWYAANVLGNQVNVGVAPYSGETRPLTQLDMVGQAAEQVRATRGMTPAQVAQYDAFRRAQGPEGGVTVERIAEEQAALPEAEQAYKTELQNRAIRGDEQALAEYMRTYPDDVGALGGRAALAYDPMTPIVRGAANSVVNTARGLGVMYNNVRNLMDTGLGLGGAQSPEERLGAGYEGLNWVRDAIAYAAPRRTDGSGAGGFAETLGEATGQLGVQLLLGSVTGGAAAPTVATMAEMGAGGWDRAIGAGASPETATTASLISTGLGLAEAIPLGRFFGVANRTAPQVFTRQALRDALTNPSILQRFATQGLAEGGTELVQAVAENFTARQLYDSMQEVLTPDALQEGFAGAILGGGLGAAYRKRNATADVLARNAELEGVSVDEYVRTLDATIGRLEQVARDNNIVPGETAYQNITRNARQYLIEELGPQNVTEQQVAQAATRIVEAAADTQGQRDMNRVMEQTLAEIEATIEAQPISQEMARVSDMARNWENNQFNLMEAAVAESLTEGPGTKEAKLESFRQRYGAAQDARAYKASVMSMYEAIEPNKAEAYKRQRANTDNRLKELRAQFDAVLNPAPKTPPTPTPPIPAPAPGQTAPEAAAQTPNVADGVAVSAEINSAVAAPGVEVAATIDQEALTSEQDQLIAAALKKSPYFSALEGDELNNTVQRVKAARVPSDEVAAIVDEANAIRAQKTSPEPEPAVAPATPVKPAKLAPGAIPATQYIQVDEAVLNGPEMEAVAAVMEAEAALQADVERVPTEEAAAQLGVEREALLKYVRDRAEAQKAEAEAEAKAEPEPAVESVAEPVAEPTPTPEAKPKKGEKAKGPVKNKKEAKAVTVQETEAQSETTIIASQTPVQVKAADATAVFPDTQGMSEQQAAVVEKAKKAYKKGKTQAESVARAGAVLDANSGAGEIDEDTNIPEGERVLAEFMAKAIPTTGTGHSPGDSPSPDALYASLLGLQSSTADPASLESLGEIASTLRPNSAASTIAEKFAEWAETADPAVLNDATSTNAETKAIDITKEVTGVNLSGKGRPADSKLPASDAKQSLELLLPLVSKTEGPKGKAPSQETIDKRIAALHTGAGQALITLLNRAGKLDAFMQAFRTDMESVQGADLAQVPLRMNQAFGAAASRTWSSRVQSETPPAVGPMPTSSEAEIPVESAAEGSAIVDGKTVSVAVDLDKGTMQGPELPPDATPEEIAARESELNAVLAGLDPMNQGAGFAPALPPGGSTPHNMYAGDAETRAEIEGAMMEQGARKTPKPSFPLVASAPPANPEKIVPPNAIAGALFDGMRALSSKLQDSKKAAVPGLRLLTGTVPKRGLGQYQTQKGIVEITARGMRPSSSPVAIYAHEIGHWLADIRDKATGARWFDSTDPNVNAELEYLATFKPASDLSMAEARKIVMEAMPNLPPAQVDVYAAQVVTNYTRQEGFANFFYLMATNPGFAQYHSGNGPAQSALYTHVMARLDALNEGGRKDYGTQVKELLGGAATSTKEWIGATAPQRKLSEAAYADKSRTTAQQVAEVMKGGVWVAANKGWAFAQKAMDFLEFRFTNREGPFQRYIYHLDRQARRAAGLAYRKAKLKVESVAWLRGKDRMIEQELDTGLIDPRTNKIIRSKRTGLAITLDYVLGPVAGGNVEANLAAVQTLGEARQTAHYYGNALKAAVANSIDNARRALGLPSGQWMESIRRQIEAAATLRRDVQGALTTLDQAIGAAIGGLDEGLRKQVQAELDSFQKEYKARAAEAQRAIDKSLAADARANAAEAKSLAAVAKRLDAEASAAARTYLERVSALSEKIRTDATYAAAKDKRSELSKALARGHATAFRRISAVNDTFAKLIAAEDAAMDKAAASLERTVGKAEASAAREVARAEASDLKSIKAFLEGDKIFGAMDAAAQGQFARELAALDYPDRIDRVEKILTNLETNWDYRLGFKDYGTMDADGRPAWDETVYNGQDFAAQIARVLHNPRSPKNLIAKGNGEYRGLTGLAADTRQSDVLEAAKAEAEYRAETAAAVAALGGRTVIDLGNGYGVVMKPGVAEIASATYKGKAIQPGEKGYAKAVSALRKSFPALAPVLSIHESLERHKEMAQAILEMQYAYGLLSDETYNRFKANPEYLPMFRGAEDLAEFESGLTPSQRDAMSPYEVYIAHLAAPTQGAGGTYARGFEGAKGAASVTDARKGVQSAKRRTGTENRRVLPFIENLAEHLKQTVEAGTLNDVYREIAGIQTQTDTDTGTDNSLGLIEVPVDARNPDRSFVVTDKGVSRAYQFDETVWPKEIVDSMKLAVSNAPANRLKWMGWLRKIANTQRRLITTVPFFSYKFLMNNPISDALSQGFYSEAYGNLGLLGYNFWADRGLSPEKMKAFAAGLITDPLATLANRNKDLEEDMRRINYAGGGQFGIGGNSTELKKLIERAKKEDPAGMKGVKVLGKEGINTLVKGWDAWAARQEGRTRVAEFRAWERKYLKEGYSQAEAERLAAVKSRELMDFTRSGTWVRTLNQYIPFLNAAIQGWSKDMRTILATDKTPEAKVAAITRRVLALNVQAFLLALLMDGLLDDEEELRASSLPRYIRDRYFVAGFYEDGGPILVPKPFGLFGGAINVWEDVLLERGGNESRAMDMFLKSLTPLGIVESHAAMGIPSIAGVETFLEVAINKNTFTRQPITYAPGDMTPERWQEFGGAERASEFGKWLSSTINRPYFQAEDFDHIVKSLLPRLGEAALLGGDALMGGDPSRLGVVVQRQIPFQTTPPPVLASEAGQYVRNELESTKVPQRLWNAEWEQAYGRRRNQIQSAFDDLRSEAYEKSRELANDQAALDAYNQGVQQQLREWRDELRAMDAEYERLKKLRQQE